MEHIADKILDELSQLKSLMSEQAALFNDALAHTTTLTMSLNHKQTWLQLLGVIHSFHETSAHLHSLYQTVEETLRVDELNADEASKVEMFFGSLTSLKQQNSKACELFKQRIRDVIKLCFPGDDTMDTKRQERLERLVGIVPSAHPYFSLVRDLAMDASS